MIGLVRSVVEQGRERWTVNATYCGFDFRSRTNYYLFIFSFLCSGVNLRIPEPKNRILKALRVEFRHSTLVNLNAFRIWRKVRS